MQRLNEIRALLSSAGLAPRRRLGQCFLIDAGSMRRLLDLAAVGPGERVLEVGPGTGSLSEELLERGARVVAVEIDPGLAALLRERLADRENFTLLEQDVLAGKSAVAPAVLEATAPAASLVSNLPYSIATPLIAECLCGTWRAVRGDAPVRFGSLTFTVQREVADRLTAGPGSGHYGPVSVLVGLLGSVSVGPVVPPGAFWPRPKVDSRILRIDYDESSALGGQLPALRRILSTVFQQRRKQIGSARHTKHFGSIWPEALSDAGIDPTLRPEQVSPERFAALARRVVE